MRTDRSWTVCCSLLPGGVSASRGVPGRGGLLPGGSASRGGWCLVGEWVSQHALRQTPLPPCGHTLVKILPWPNFVAAGNYTVTTTAQICVWTFNLHCYPLVLRSSKIYPGQPWHEDTRKRDLLRTLASLKVKIKIQFCRS